MLGSTKHLRGFRIAAIDDDIGEHYEVYFDDQQWAARYLVVDSDHWLPGRRVLVSPASVKWIDWPGRRIHVSLTADQVRNSPDVGTDVPVDRQAELTLVQYFGWPTYWFPPSAGMGGTLYTSPDLPTRDTATDERLDPHLRGERDVVGYHIHATDGQLGHVADFIIDDQDWALRYLVVDTRNWLPGRHVLISPTWVSQIDWVTRMVHVDLDREPIRHAPRFDPDMPIDREYEQALFAHYGRKGYWEGNT